jgi:hypothetical protein
LADALKSVGARSQGMADDPTEAWSIDDTPSPEQVRLEHLQERLRDAGPGDHAVIAEVLRDPDLSVQLLALDRLSQMPKWDPTARQMLREVRDYSANEAIRRQAAAILQGLPELPSEGPS